jgi:hypothetical protein
LLKVWSSFAQNPIVWNPDRNAYSTTVSIGLQVAAGAEDARDLPKTIPVVLAGRGAYARTSVQSVEFERIGSGAQSVEFICDRHGSEVALLTIVDGREEAHPAAILATTARLKLRPTGDEMPAFGLGEVGLNLERIAEDGYPLLTGGAETATLSASGATLSAESLSFAPGESVASGVKVRSRRPGDAKVTASVGGREFETSIQTTWPWLLLFSSLLGGAIGGLVRRKEAGDDPADSTPGPATRALTGAVVGLVVVILILTGLVALQQVPSGAAGSAAGAFALALLAGFAGLPLLRAMASRLGPG